MEAVLSSRRLKKCPGRRPPSAERQKFMELLERRWSVRGAAREVSPDENTTGWTRDSFSKGTDLSVHTAEHLLAVETEVNRRPRQVLGNRSPFNLLYALLASENSPCCDVGQNHRPIIRTALPQASLTGGLAV